MSGVNTLLSVYFWALLVGMLFLSCRSSPRGGAAEDQILLVDTHNDVLSGTVLKGYDISTRLDTGNTDLVRMKEGGVNLQIFAVFGDGSYTGDKGYAFANRQIDSLYALASRNGQQLGIAHSVEQARSIINQGKIAGMLGLEGGHLLGGKLDRLDSLRKKGVVYMTLTWNNSNALGSSAVDENDPEHPSSKAGLSAFGKQTVERMNALGMAVDLSHVGRHTFFDAIEVSALPVLVSHANAKAICDVDRNLTDAQLEAVARNRGVVCVTFYAPFVDGQYYQRIEETMGNYPRLIDSLKEQGFDTRDQLIAAFLSSRPELAQDLSVPIEKLVDHIEHMVEVAGIDHVGIGGDYYGLSTLPFPQGLHDVTGYPLLIQALFDRGYSREEVQKIAGENVLRVLSENLKVSKVDKE